MEEKERALYDLAEIIMANEKSEAEAVEGYTVQLKLIENAREELRDEALLGFLDRLEAATKEKISDELNHGESLYAEYVELTGIKSATN